MKNPAIAVALSLIPGLGQLYVGKTRKGITLLSVDAGMIVSHIFFPSRITWFLTGVIYLAAVFSSGIQSYHYAKGGQVEPKPDSKMYVVLMLLATGFSALPLLWEQVRFSKRFKVLWTIAVPLLAILFFWFCARRK